MKKLLVSALVMGIASLASAGMVYQVGGVNYAAGSTVEASGDVTVLIWNETRTTEAPLIGGVTDGTAGKIGSVTPNAANLPGTWGTNDAYYASYGVYMITYDTPATADTLAGELFAVSMTGVVDGDTLTMVDGSWAPLDAGISFVVPEPATMALLGLGALVLRRKK